VPASVDPEKVGAAAAAAERLPDIHTRGGADELALHKPIEIVAEA